MLSQAGQSSSTAATWYPVTALAKGRSVQNTTRRSAVKARGFHRWSAPSWSRKRPIVGQQPGFGDADDAGIVAQLSGYRASAHVDDQRGCGGAIPSGIAQDTGGPGHELPGLTEGVPEVSGRLRRGRILSWRWMFSTAVAAATQAPSDDIGALPASTSSALMLGVSGFTRWRKSRRASARPRVGTVGRHLVAQGAQKSYRVAVRPKISAGAVEQIIGGEGAHGGGAAMYRS